MSTLSTFSFGAVKKSPAIDSRGPWRRKMGDLIRSNDDLMKSSFGLLNDRSVRPGITTFDYSPSYTNRLWLSWCYWYEDEVSILSDIMQKMREEIFRYGFKWKPLFAKKCAVCEQEYDDDLDECEICHSKNLREPDKTQLRLARVDRYNTFVERANINKQTLKDVLKTVMFHTLVTDNGYLLILKDYHWQQDGSLKAFPREFMALDPRDVIKLFDLETGYPGKGRVCLDHRSSLLGENDKTCPECGKPTFRAHYQVFTATKTSTYYIEDEIFHLMCYYPGMIYGYPKCLKIKDELVSYHMIERRVRNYYEFCKVAGILFIPTDDPDSLQEMWQKTRDSTKDDPFTPAVLAVSEYAPTNANLIRLMQDPNGDLIAIKDELRTRIASSYGITLALINDTGPSGGMKNDKNMISIAEKNIRSLQEEVDDKLLRWVSISLGITDWALEIEPNINENKMEKEEVRAAQINNAERLAAMGMKVIWKGDDYTVGKGPLMSAEMMMGMGGMPGGVPMGGMGGMPLPPQTPMGGAMPAPDMGGMSLMPDASGGASMGQAGLPGQQPIQALDALASGQMSEPMQQEELPQESIDDKYKNAMSNLDDLLGTKETAPKKKTVKTKLSLILDEMFMSSEDEEKKIIEEEEEEEMNAMAMPGMGAPMPGSPEAMPPLGPAPQPLGPPSPNQPM